eukprot:1158674-Pelagomonas_calceolata.AAC.2
MDVFCLAGRDQQAEQSNRLAGGCVFADGLECKGITGSEQTSCFPIMFTAQFLIQVSQGLITTLRSPG